jgi:hypothetical protein
MPGIQPGIIGPEDIPVLVEMFVSMFLPQTTAKIHRTGTLSLDLKSGVINSVTVTSGGSGYTSVPTVTSVDSGTPSGYTTATLTASLTNGSVSSIAIGNGGKDYNVPTLTIAAPSAITFDGSDDEVLGTGIVNITDNTIKLTTAQQEALPVGSLVTYNTTGGAIDGLSSAPGFNQYYIVSSTGGKVKLSATEGGTEIDFDGVGSGTDHSFTGETATATATKLDGALESVTIAEPGFGYASAPAVSFSGIDVSGQTGVAPVVTIGIDSKGRLDEDNITIVSEGSNWSNLFGQVAANTNAGQIAEVEAIGFADKNYTTAPQIIFPQPQSKDALGNLLPTNVTATAEFTIASNDVLWTQAEEDLERLGDAAYQADPNTGTPPVPEGLRVPIIAGAVKIFKGEITGVSITNAGNGYINDPQVTLGSAVNNEIRVADQQEILDLSLNHNDVQPITSTVVNPRQTSGSIMTSTGTAVKFLPEHTVKVVNPNFRTIINNGYKQRKGPANFFTSPRLYNTNQTIAFLGSNTIETINSNDINKYNTSTFVHIE